MTNIFPILTDVNAFRDAVMHKEEMREAVIADNCISFCYMISSENTFDSPETRECRGIVFSHQTGKVIARPLHKFFNVNERPSTLNEALPWDTVIRIMDKMDGSTIHTVLMDDGSVKLKSKKSFNSDVARNAQAFADASPNLSNFIRQIAQHDYTAIFEYCSPDARIVLYYPQTRLVLLHVRDNTTGEYVSRSGLEKLASTFNIELVEEVTFKGVGDHTTLGQHMINTAKEAEGIEGWIVQFANGDMVKLKTDWYLKRHRAMTFLRERDIAVLTLDEGLDDLKALLVGEGADISEILRIEEDVVDQIRKIHSVLFSAVNDWRHLDRKDFAIKFQGDVYFGLIMQQYLGKPPAIKEWFERNLLKQRYGLRQLNLMQSVAEVE